MQETQVRSLPQEDEDLTCPGAIKPAQHNYWRGGSSARELQQLKTVCLEPMVRHERSHDNVKPGRQN